MLGLFWGLLENAAGRDGEAKQEGSVRTRSEQVFCFFLFVMPSRHETQSPVSQRAPVKPVGHKQVKLATWSTHSAPFRHGCDSHSSTSAGGPRGNF